MIAQLAHTFHIDVTGMPISYTDGEGNALTKIGDKYYKNTDITDGVPNKDAVAVDPEKVTDNIKVINKDGSTTNPGTISNVKSAIDGVVGNGAQMAVLLTVKVVRILSSTM